jgi:hypothetical protein
MTARRAGDCDAKDGVIEVKEASTDLGTLGLDNRVGSVHCEWQE